MTTTILLVGLGFVCYILLKIFGVLCRIDMHLEKLVKLA